jgi:Tfp pilus assembly protein PilV
MELNPLTRVLRAKATTFVGLAMLVALVMMVMASLDSVGQAGAKPKPTSHFGAKEVISANGPLPASGTYTSKGGRLIISAAGSGWSATKDQLIGMTVSVNNKQVGTAETWTNEPASHKAFVSVFPVVTVPKGNVNIKLDKLNAQTNTDQNDRYRVTVVELPR